MATQAIAGFKGQLYVSSDGSTYTKLCELREVTLSIERDTIDASSHCSEGWKDNILGLAQWKASGEALYVDGDAQQDLLYDALVDQNDVFIRVTPKGDDAVAGDSKFEGTALVTSWELGLPNDDIQNISMEFLGKGPLVKGTV